MHLLKEEMKFKEKKYMFNQDNNLKLVLYNLS